MFQSIDQQQAIFTELRNKVQAMQIAFM